MTLSFYNKSFSCCTKFSRCVRNSNVLFSTSQVAHRKKKWSEGRRSVAWTDDRTWEERLADAVTPLWRLSYDEQLEVKQKKLENILTQLCTYISQSPPSKINFPVQTILPSPAVDGYRNKSTFSVNRGVDGNPKTVGYFLGTGRQDNLVCVNGDHLKNIPEKHKLVARYYQDFIRTSSLDPCLFYHAGGNWRHVTVRTNKDGHTMAVVYFHPQMLTAQEVGVHKAELVDFFTNGPGSVCRLDSIFFQESTKTVCTHEEAPYQLLYGLPHIYEEVLGFRFRISVDAFFQINQAAAQVLYGTVRDLCFPDFDGTKKGGTLLDVCCGTGAIGISLSNTVDRIVGIEMIEQAVKDARHNAELNNVSNCEFIAGKAEVVLPKLMLQMGSSDGSVTAVVNPARPGLHYRVIQALRNQTAIRRLVYISCKPEGEAMRNFQELCCAPNPRKKLTAAPFCPTLAVPVDMFPHTEQCELVLLLER